MHTALVALGANLGHRQRQLDAAIAALEARSDTAVRAKSNWYETAPVGGPAGQEPFLNGAVLLDTELLPTDLLDVLQDIERAAGRRPRERWAARPLDLDLLLYDDLACEAWRLTLPHPRLAVRRFVLEPAAEIAPELVHPVIGWTLRRLLEHLHDAVPYAAIGGLEPARRRAFARKLLESTLGWLATDPQPADSQPGGPQRRDWQATLERQSALIERDHWPAVRAWGVSDFWFDQLLVEAMLESDSAELAARQVACEAARARVTLPKVVFVLEHSLAAPADEDEVRRRTALGELARSPGLGPVLPLDLADEPRALAEAQAALAAMQ